MPQKIPAARREWPGGSALVHRRESQARHEAPKGPPVRIHVSCDPCMRIPSGRCTTTSSACEKILNKQFNDLHIPPGNKIRFQISI